MNKKIIAWILSTFCAIGAVQNSADDGVTVPTEVTGAGGGASAAETTNSGNPFVDYTSRPSELSEAIQSGFAAMNAATQTKDWACWTGDFSLNGTTDYGVMGPFDRSILAHRILSNPQQKEWTFLDLGAGQCGWGRGLAKFLNRIFAERLEMGDLVISIISLTGDVQKVGSYMEPGCKVTEYYSFNSEIMSETALFQELRGRIDFIFSYGTFLHLGDPIGTFAQAFDMLKFGGMIACTHISEVKISAIKIPFKDVLNTLEIPFVERCNDPRITCLMVMKPTATRHSSPLLTYNTVEVTPRPQHGVVAIGNCKPCHVNFESRGDLRHVLELRTYVLKASFPFIDLRQPSCSELQYKTNEPNLLRLVVDASRRPDIYYDFTNTQDLLRYFFGECGIDSMSEDTINISKEKRLKALTLNQWELEFPRFYELLQEVTLTEL